MLRYVVAIAAGAALALAVGTRPAEAMSEGVVVEAHVPFAFQVNGRTLPAGDYHVKSIGIYERNVLEIASTDPNGPSEFVIALPQDSSRDLHHAEMIFDEVGAQHFLRAIEVPGVKGARLNTAPAELKAVRAEDGISTTRQG